MALKNLRIEDVVLGFIVFLAFLYPGIIAFLIHKSDRPGKSLEPIVEYLQGKECLKDGPEGVKVKNVEGMVEVCEVINREGYKLKDVKTEEDRAVLSYGKKVKGVERRLIVNLEFEGNEVKSVSYEEGN